MKDARALGTCTECGKIITTIHLNLSGMVVCPKCGSVLDKEDLAPLDTRNNEDDGEID